jgi:uncharacterized protein with ParB-like and HNH nuclease domain
MKIMSKIQLSQRMYSIRDIDRLLKSKEMVIQPKYQRRRTGWPINAKTALIDTILNNYPLPPIYLRDYVNDEGKRRKEIIDGQQRISTITEFISNEYRLSKVISDGEFAGQLFSELPTEEQQKYEDFEVSFISIRGASDADIISIFSRLNSFSLPLNTQEKRNAKYAGELKSLIYEISSEYNTFWTDFKILSENNIARMADALLVSEILYTILYGIKSASAPGVDKMYSKYEENLPDRKGLYERFTQTITVLGNFFESKHIRYVFNPKFMFYSIFLVVYSRLFGFAGNEDEKTGSINIEESIKKLESFCVQYQSEDYDPAKKAKFNQATGNLAQRNFRHQEILKLIQ